MEGLQLVSLQRNPPEGGLRQGTRFNPEIGCFHKVLQPMFRYNTLKYDNEKGPGGIEKEVRRMSQPSGKIQGFPGPIDFLVGPLFTCRLSIFS